MAISNQAAWEMKVLPPLVRGLDSVLASENLPDGYLAVGLNVRVQQGRLRKDSGYAAFGSTVRGTPQHTRVWTKNDGTEELLHITTATMYKYAATPDEWQYVSNGTSTTVANAGVATDTYIDVTSSTGFTDGGYIGIAMDDGTQHQTTVNGAPSVGGGVGGSDRINIDDALPSAAAATNVVVEPPAFTGNVGVPITSESWQPDDWFIFTNGVDVPQRYDGSTCEDIAGLSAVNVGTARSLIVARNQILLIRPTESSVIYPNRVRRCDIGDGSTWSGGNAGTEDIPEGLTNLHTGRRFGDDVILYFDNGIVAYTYTGDTTDLWRYEVISRLDGVVGPAAVDTMGGAHVFLGHKDVWLYAGGSTMIPLGRQAMAQASALAGELFGLQGTLSLSAKQRSQVRVVSELNEVWIIVPSSSTSPTKLFRFNLSTQGWFERDLTHGVLDTGYYQETSGETWTSISGTWNDWPVAWDSPVISTAAPVWLLANSDGTQVYKYDLVSANDAGTAINWSIETGDYENHGMKHRLDFVEVWCAGAAFTVEASANGGSSWSLLGTITPDAEFSSKRVYYQLVGASLRFRLSGSGTTTIGNIGWRWRPESVI